MRNSPQFARNSAQFSDGSSIPPQTIAFKLTPLYALRVVPSALSEALVQPAVRARPASGYLTMEQTRKLLPLGEGDPKAFEVPLVGVWVAGTADAAAPLAWAAAARFASLRDSGRAVTAPNGAFLLLHYAAEPPAHAMAPKLYEVAPQLSDTPYTLVSGAIEIDPTNLDTADAPAVVCELGVTVSAPLTEAMRAAGVWNPPPAQPLTDKELRGSEAWLAAIAARSRDPEPTPPKPPAAAKAPVGAAPPPAEEAPRPPTEWTDPVAAVSAAAGGGSEVASLLLSMQAQIVALTSQVEAQQKTIAELSKRPKGKSVARQLLAETASYGAGASSAPAPAPARDAAAELEEVMRRYGIGSAAPPAKKAASPAKAKAAAKAASPAKAAPAAKAPPAPRRRPPPTTTTMSTSRTTTTTATSTTTATTSRRSAADGRRGAGAVGHAGVQLSGRERGATHRV